MRFVLALCFLISCTLSASGQTETGRLEGSDATLGGFFGLSVGLGQGTAVVGSPRNTANGALSGAAYVFDGMNGWQESGKLVPSDGSAGFLFGTSVDADGDLVIVGSEGDNVNGARSGSAHVFRRTNGSWVEEAKLVPSNGQANAFFGGTVSISESFAAVGSRFHDQVGRVFVYQFDGSDWAEMAILSGRDGGGTTGWDFGHVVTLKGDLLIVGAPYDNTGADNAGAAYVFRYDGTQWGEEAKLQADTPESDAHFGISVATDGQRLIVGARRANGAGLDQGSAYIFEQSGGTWSQTAVLTAADGADQDEFGSAVGIDGAFVVVGAMSADGVASDTGAIYAFQESDGVWNQLVRLTTTDAAASHRLGQSIAAEATVTLSGSALANGFKGVVYRYGDYGTSTAIDESIDTPARRTHALDLWPNPTSGQVHIEAPLSADESRIRIHDILGRDVTHHARLIRVSPTRFRIELPPSTGSYLITVDDEHGRRTSLAIKY